MKYPEFYYPSKIDEILKSQPPNPQIPEESEPVPPIKPKQEDYFSGIDRTSFSYIMLVAVGITFIILTILRVYNTSEHDDSSFLMYFFAFLFCLLFGLLASLTFPKRQDLKNLYQKQLELYEEEMKSYNVNLVDFKKKHAEYTTKFLCSIWSPKKGENDSSILKYRKNEFMKFLKESTSTPVPIKTCVKNGVAEHDFLKELKKDFADKIYTKLGLQCESYLYYPDFVYWDKEKSFILDIEIDEPYIGSNGAPIHYLESDLNSMDSTDSFRNKTFLEKNWFIIRFAEEQIIKHPQICISIISQIIDLVENFEKFDFVNVIYDEHFNIDKWDKDEAHRMAFHRFRYSYLPQKLQSKITEETYKDFELIESTEVFDDLPF